MVIKTFRFRLFILIVLSTVIIFLISISIAFLNFKKRFYEAVDRDLSERASSLVTSGTGQLRVRPNEKLIERVKNDYFQIINEGGQVIVSSLTADHLWPVNRELMNKAFEGSTVFETIRFKGEDHRIIYFPLSKNRILCVARSLEEIEELSGEIKRDSIIISSVSVLIVMIMSWLISKKAASPLKAITAFGEQVRAGRLKKETEIEVKGQEIERLIEVFNGILENVRSLTETQKRFTQDVSHEIRSPLTSLRGNIEVALRKKRTPEEYEDVLKSSLFDVIRLIRITDDLLFLARADNNIIELRKNWFDLNHLLRAIIGRFDHEGISIHEDYREGIEYYGDINLLEQAFSNIIQNSIKYTPSGGSVTVSTDEDDNSIRVKITDTGIGIPEKDLPHIFDRFYRVDKERSRKFGGTGLGLSIAKWIIDNHGGTISVESKINNGTVFTISLPKDTIND